MTAAKRGGGRPPVRDIVPGREDKADWRWRALAHFAEWGTEAFAAQAAGVTPRHLRRSLEKHPNFRQLWEEAKGVHRDYLLKLLMERIRETRRPMSDVLLMFKIKQLDPTFREHYRPSEERSGDAIEVGKVAEILLRCLPKEQLGVVLAEIRKELAAEEARAGS